MNKKRFRVLTLGCRTNQYESAAYKRQLESAGYVPAKDGEAADLCIVNTCTVTESADQRSRYQIRSMARQSPGAEVVVTGCFAERQPDFVRQMDGVSAVVSNADKDQLLPQVFPNEEWPEFKIDQFADHTRAFVKVQDGCNSYCSYCVIPFVRGRSRSRKTAEIVEEVEDLVAKGYKEVVITGINVGDFDGAVAEGEKPDSLADLVKAVDAVPGLQRLRISSIDPDEVDEELLQAVVAGKNTCPSMHIVLQAGSNLTLKRMRRKYTRQIFLETCDRLRAAHPDFTFTTDVIVGFPGETEEDFEETLQVIDEIAFAKVHMFPYSDRPKTRASRMEGKLENHVKKERKDRLMRHAEKTAFALREAFVGREMEVLTESAPSGGLTESFGHTENFLGVWIEGPKLRPNSLVKVKLEKNTPEGLLGRISR